MGAGNSGLSLLALVLTLGAAPGCSAVDAAGCSCFVGLEGALVVTALTLEVPSDCRSLGGIVGAAALAAPLDPIKKQSSSRSLALGSLAATLVGQTAPTLASGPGIFGATGASVSSSYLGSKNKNKK